MSTYDCFRSAASNSKGRAFAHVDPLTFMPSAFHVGEIPEPVSRARHGEAALAHEHTRATVFATFPSLRVRRAFND